MNIQERIHKDEFIWYMGIKIHKSLLLNDDFSEGLEYNPDTKVVYVDEYTVSGSTCMEHFDNMQDALFHAVLEIGRIGLKNDNHYVLPEE